MGAVDVAILAKLMADLGDDPVVMEELVATFLVEGPRLVAGMRESLDKQDRRNLNRAVHSLKSTSATFGAMHLWQLCKDLERDTETGIPVQAGARVAQVEAEWAAAQKELAAWKPGA